MGPTDEDYSHIRDKIVDYLARQDFSEAKLLLKVTDLKKRYPHTARYRFYTRTYVQKVIDELKGEGIINERRYAENTLRQLMDKKDGILRMKQKLYRRLIDPRVIEKVLHEFELSGKKQRFDIIRKLVLRKQNELTRKRLHPSVLRQKLYAFLAQKGYLPDDIEKILHDGGS